jgi:anion-transporting  ArsA/GET3 family ATPase
VTRQRVDAARILPFVIADNLPSNSRDLMPIEPERSPMRTSRAAESIHHLKEEIDKLTAQQTEARNLAIYVGMTPDEAAEYDECRGRSLQYV